MASADFELANHFVEAIRQLGVAATSGEDVSKSVSETVSEALDRFIRLKLDPDPASTLEYFILQLRTNADLTEAANPEFAKTLRWAAALAQRASTESDT